MSCRPGDLRNPRKFCALDPPLRLDDAPAPDRQRSETCSACRCPLTAGHGCSGVAGAVPPQKAPDSHLPHRKASAAQLAPYQDAGLGWLAFRTASTMAPPGTDDQGLGKKTSCWPPSQHLSSEQD